MRTRFLDHFDTQRDGLWLKYYTVGSGESHTTLSGRRWGGIQQRTLLGGYAQNNCPSYIGVTNDFSGFQEFVEWSQQQVGYNERENKGGKSLAWSLDKDLLGDGKSYNPDSCIFVPSRINCFLTSRARERGQLPLGVCGIRNKYKSYIGEHGEFKNLGFYDTPIEAHRAWQLRKVDIALEYVCEYIDTHPKLAVGLQAFADLILDDHTNYRFTEY